MSSPIPSAETIPLVALQEDITPASVSEQTTNLICRQPHQAEVTIHVGKVQEKDKTEQNEQNEVKMAQMQPIQSHDSKTEETALNTQAQKDQTPVSKHVNFSQPHPSPLPPTQLSFTCQPDPCHQTQHFQVNIHQVQSRQSLSQNDEQRYQIIFTKSQINIPLQYQGSEDDEQKEKQLRLAQLDLPSCSVRPSTDEDFYVHFLQDKWAKKEHEEQQLNQLINHLQFDYQQSQTAPNSMEKSTSNNQILTAPKSDQSQTHKIPHSLTTKNKFKVKKIHDKHTLSIINLKNPLSTSQILPINPSSNKSEVIDSKRNYLKPYNYNRGGKKNISNFEGCPNKYLTKLSIYKKQIDPNVQYEISDGKGIEMMSRILEDRCYNNGDKKGSQNVEGKADAANKIRKIIKRSPYGILEIEVKDKKNNAKITNLRILKPKEMIRLKKMPNLIKGNKENTASGPATKQSNIQSQKEIGQGGLPLLNYNKK